MGCAVRGGGGASRPAGTCVLPDGSCTELPRGPSLCPARISSVPGTSGWESAGSRKHVAPAPARARTRLLSLTPAGPGSRPEASRLAFCTWQKKKQKNRRAAVSQAPRSADSGLPSALGGGKKKSGPSSHRIKLDLTSQQLKEVTALTPTLPGSQRAAGLEHRLWSVLEMIQRCKYFEKAEWKAEDTLGPYFS